MFWLIVALFAVLIIAYYEGRKQKLKDTPPGPLANHIPFVGFLPFLHSKQPQQSFIDLSKKYGKIYSLQMGSIYTVVLSDVQLIREAFKREEISGRAPLLVTHGIFHGQGLICTEGDFWKDQRNLVQKWLKELGMMKFGVKRETMQNRILDGINLCITEITNSSSHELNPLHIFSNTVGNIVNDFVFGVTYSWDDATWKHLQHLQDEGIKLVGVSAIGNFLPVLRFLPNNQKNMRFLLTGLAETHKIYDEIADDCEKTLDDESHDSILRRFLLEKRDRELKEHKLAKNCSRIQLNYLLADIFGASLDTTLCTLRWFMLLIAKHHDVQENIYDEMKNFGLKKQFTLEDIEHLHYLKASIAESQRLKTVIPCGIPHGNPTQSTTLGGYFIPQNTMILPLLSAIHMDEKVWENPQTYCPDRFIDSNGKFFTHSHFIPYQTGKRKCVGEELAKMLLTLFCANILVTFDIIVGRDFETLDLSGTHGLTLIPPDHCLVFNKREPNL